MVLLALACAVVLTLTAALAVVVADDARARLLVYGLCLIASLTLLSVATNGVAPVRADAGRVEQAVVNLVLNARDAVRIGGRVRVEVAPARLGAPLAHALGTVPAGDFVALRVRDDGCGMDAAARDRLFQPFYTTKPGGTGLGLAIVARVARECGAAVTVETEPVRGTTFTLYFPRADQSHQ